VAYKVQGCREQQLGYVMQGGCNSELPWTTGHPTTEVAVTQHPIGLFMEAAWLLASNR
jgi:hypothetical protein